jgi:hypothetical protein
MHWEPLLARIVDARSPEELQTVGISKQAKFMPRFLDDVLAARSNHEPICLKF